ARQGMDGDRGRRREKASDVRANSWRGPARGPVASRTPTPPTARALGRAAAVPAPRLASPGRTRPPIEVTVGALEDVGAESRISQRFVLPHPRDAVWRVVSDVGGPGGCVAGALVGGAPTGGQGLGGGGARHRA